TPNDVNVIERFDADFDVRHRIVFSANYELPFGRSFTGAMKMVLAGGQVNGVASLRTGFPFTVTNAATRSNTSANNDRPNVVGDATLDDPSIGQWFDAAAFSAHPINPS